MKIFLSALEASYTDIILKQVKNVRWVLCSYYYLKQDKFERILKQCDEMLIDSGAHSFQKGKKVDWDEYTRKYAEWIKENDNPKMVGYFEMDIDNIVGYEKVKELRKVLERVTDKIIPVWHKNRGIAEYEKMCRDYAGKIVAITGWKNEDITDGQYLMFLKTAKKHGCKVHALGMTRKAILDKVPFDYVDSSSWKQQAIRGKVNNKKVSRAFSKKNTDAVVVASFCNAMRQQEHYYRKWKRESND